MRRFSNLLGPTFIALGLGLVSGLACSSVGEDLWGGTGSGATGAATTGTGTTSTGTGTGTTSADGGNGVGGAGASGAGTTTGTGASGAQGGGGGTVGSEDCLNGQDDDGNGLADCDDPACNGAGYWCLPAAPGADSFLAFGGGACAAPMEPIPLSTCSDCSCQGEDGSCFVALQAYVQASCQQLYAQPTGPGCFDAQPDGQRWFRATAESYGDEQCYPDSPVVDPTTQSACGLAAVGSCGAGGACVPPSFQGERICILVSPEVGCPGAYPERHDVYLGGGLCSCECDVAGTVCDQPLVQIDTTGDWCQSATLEVALGPECTGVGFARSIEVPDVASTPSCALRATVDGEPPTHAVCCQP